MDKMLTLKRPLIWVRRFRKRCGYGVHSPSAFDFITNVIYEKASYYAYSDIKRSEQYKRIQLEKKERQTSDKVNKLLFRIVNRFQPNTVAVIGPSFSMPQLYIKAAKKNMDSLCCSTLNKSGDDILEDIRFFTTHYSNNLDFIFVSYSKDKETTKKILTGVLDNKLLSEKAIIVIEGICYNLSIKQFWDELIADIRTVTTYDLYDLGIAFLEPGKIKQHYKVNF